MFIVSKLKIIIIVQKTYFFKNREIEIKPDPTQPSLLRESVTLRSFSNPQNVYSLPLCEIPGCSYRSKLCFILSNPTTNWFHILLQNVEP